MLTLDYELFFGSRTGTIEGCIITPTKKILEVLDQYGVKASFFVDVCYLERLYEERREYPQLQQDYDNLTRQIKSLFHQGHDIQLHIHPHWRDSHFSEGEWKIDARRYRLIDWPIEQVAEMFKRGTKLLNEILDTEVFVYRAGGWCIQPFEHLSEAMKNSGISVDSTVFKGGRNLSKTHFFNFLKAPDKTHWKFSVDPLIEDCKGNFFEIAISSITVSPLFFWKLAFAKKIGGDRHKNLGDGLSLPTSRKDIIRMLTCYSHSVVSMDGYRSSLLQGALNKCEKNFTKNDYFVVIGHPKITTSFSLQQLEKFLAKNIEQHYFTTYRHEKDTGYLNN